MTDTLDRKTIFHCIRTSLYAVRVALNKEREDLKVRDVWLAALLHDIGKAKIPKPILNKAGKLTAEEMLVMKTHARKGTEMLEGRLPAAITDAVLYHHEIIDGTGYYGVSDNDIPEAAKIIRVCDVYDSLISQRPYKEPWTKDEALIYLWENSGTMFDPVYAHILCREVVRDFRKKICSYR